MYAFYNTRGKEIIPFELTKANDFQEDLAAVAARGHRWGFIDRQGNWVLDGYQHTQSFAFGLAPVRVKRRYGYLHKDQKWLISPRFRNAYSFQGPGLAVARKKRKYGVIDTLGHWVLKKRFQRIQIASDHIWALQGGKVRYFDWDGKRMDVVPIQQQDSSYSPIERVVNNHLNQVHTGKVKSYTEGVWVCQQNEQFGLLNASGDVIVPVAFDKIDVAEKGKTYTLFRQGRCSYVNQDGDWIFKNE